LQEFKGFYKYYCELNESRLHAEQVKGEDPDKNGYPGSPVWGLGVALLAIRP
jgi:hypothetical protein